MLQLLWLRAQRLPDAPSEHPAWNQLVQFAYRCQPLFQRSFAVTTATTVFKVRLDMFWLNLSQVPHPVGPSEKHRQVMPYQPVLLARVVPVSVEHSKQTLNLFGQAFAGNVITGPRGHFGQQSFPLPTPYLCPGRSTLPVVQSMNPPAVAGSVFARHSHTYGHA